MREQAIIAALDELARVRKEVRGFSDLQHFQVKGQSKGFYVCVDRAMQAARAARKRTLNNLKRAVERAQPLAGQLSLLEQTQ